MDNSEEPYCWFPISLLRGFSDDVTGTIHRIIEYDLTRSSLKRMQLPVMEKVASTLNYAIYRNPESIHTQLKDLLDQCDFEWVGKDDYYSGFAGDKFAVEENPELIKSFQSEPRLYEEAIRFWAVDQMFFLRDITKTPELMKSIISKSTFFEEASGPITSAKVSTLFSLRDSHPTDKYFITQLVYWAIKSIVGSSPFAKTNWDHVSSRVLGFASKKALKEHLTTHSLSESSTEILSIFNKRRQKDNIILDLRYHKHLKYHAHGTRGFYVSIEKTMSDEKLKKIARSKTRKGKLEAINKRPNQGYSR
jgi:hypothetical protein